MSPALRSPRQVDEYRHFPSARVDIDTIRSHTPPFTCHECNRYPCGQFPATVNRAKMIDCLQHRIVRTKRPERERTEDQLAEFPQRFLPPDKLELIAAIRLHDGAGRRHTGSQPIPPQGSSDCGSEIAVAFPCYQKAAKLEMIDAPSMACPLESGPP